MGWERNFSERVLSGAVGAEHTRSLPKAPEVKNDETIVCSYEIFKQRETGTLISREGETVNRYRMSSLQSSSVAVLSSAVAVEPVCLLRNHDRIVSTDEILNSIWKARIVSDTTLSSLRRAVPHPK